MILNNFRKSPSLWTWFKTVPRCPNHILIIFIISYYLVLESYKIDVDKQKYISAYYNV